MAQILLIESDAPFAKNLSQALSKGGHKVVWQVDPQAAINDADKKSPDVIIIELLLANRSGVEFLYEFRSYPEWSDVPVIILSGLSEHEIRIDEPSLKQLDIERYFYKPNTALGDVVEAVNQLASEK